MLTDKEADSILEDAIKLLEERVNVLEEELARPNHGSYSKEEELFENEAKTDGQQNVLIRIVCEKQEGQIPIIMSEIEKFNLSVSNISAMPFGDHLLAISVLARVILVFICPNSLFIKVCVFSWSRHSELKHIFA